MKLLSDKLTKLLGVEDVDHVGSPELRRTTLKKGNIPMVDEE